MRKSKGILIALVWLLAGCGVVPFKKIGAVSTTVLPGVEDMPITTTYSFAFVANTKVSNVQSFQMAGWEIDRSNRNDLTFEKGDTLMLFLEFEGRKDQLSNGSGFVKRVSDAYEESNLDFSKPEDVLECALAIEYQIDGTVKFFELDSLDNSQTIAMP